MYHRLLDLFNQIIHEYFWFFEKVEIKFKIIRK